MYVWCLFLFFVFFYCPLMDAFVTKRRVPSAQRTMYRVTIGSDDTFKPYYTAPVTARRSFHM